MTAAADLRTLLLASSAVTALVAQRVRLERAEEDDPLPYVVLQLSDTENQQGLDGALLASKAVLQVQCWGTTRTQVDGIAEVVKAAVLADQRSVIGPSGEYLPELKLEGAILTVDWWDD